MNPGFQIQTKSWLPKLWLIDFRGFHKPKLVPKLRVVFIILLVPEIKTSSLSFRDSKKRNPFPHSLLRRATRRPSSASLEVSMTFDPRRDVRNRKLMNFTQTMGNAASLVEDIILLVVFPHGHPIALEVFQIVNSTSGALVASTAVHPLTSRQLTLKP